MILQMDEVHIRSDASYKGGRVIGSIDNPDDPITTVFSMIVSSLSAKFSTIARLIPLGSSSAETLYPIVKSTICDIEAFGLFVEAVCTLDTTTSKSSTTRYNLLVTLLNMTNFYCSFSIRVFFIE